MSGRDSYQEQMSWLKRYFSLPYDLAQHSFAQTQQMIAMMMFYDRAPILIAEAHK